MSDCCDPIPYRNLFDEKAGERRLRDYRRNGLDPMAERLVGFLLARGVEGQTILEVGGGIGEIQVELLEAGARHSVNVELSDGYEDAAVRLLTERGLTDRVERRLGDFVEQGGEVEPADIVVLNRVICCYPWMERIVDAATSHARSLLALAFPRDHWLNHVWLGLDNAVNRLRRNDFRAFIHPVSEIESRLTGAGMSRVYARQSTVWLGRVYQRT
ncbi:MAG TPA: class I SAM-dependent methyltransferase [Acidimicrobiia bacterium]|jgi:magnesium-protoporphyrin O-methyltransferase|nr:class I SAM-dependent methyltransferase [Acidimicrobiia bacterium]